MKSRTRILAFSTGALACALAACSVITGLNGDYTRQDEDNAGDAGDATASADGPVSMMDGNGGDGTMPGDAGTFCEQNGDAANVAFCWDFEQSGSDPAAGFEHTEVTGGIGSLALSYDGGTNGSTCLIATLTRPNTNSNQAYIQKIIRGDGGPDDQFQAWNEHDLTFAFKVIHNELNAATLGSLGFSDALVVTGVSSWIAMGQQEIDISSPPGDVGGSAPPTVFGAWFHGEVNLKRTASGVPYAMTISVTDAANHTEAVDEGSVFDGGVGNAELLFGAYFSSKIAADAGDAGISVGIDDILYTRKR